MGVEEREEPESLNSTNLQENPDLGKFYTTNDLVFFTHKNGRGWRVGISD